MSHAYRIFLFSFPLVKLDNWSFRISLCHPFVVVPLHYRPIFYTRTLWSHIVLSKRAPEAEPTANQIPIIAE